MAAALVVSLFGIGCDPSGAVAAEPFALDTVEIGGKPVPKGIPDLALFTLLSVAQPWRADAMAVRLEVSELRGRYQGYEVRLYFLSPADSAGLTVLFRPEGVIPVESRSANWGEHPLPLEFIDLPEMMQSARAFGMTGALRKADLQVWDRSGPTWRLSIHGGQVRQQFSALTGDRIVGDVTGYIDDYNAQWDAAMAGIRQKLQGLAGLVPNLWGDGFDGDRFKGFEKAVCPLRGGHWHSGTCNY